MMQSPDVSIGQLIIAGGVGAVALMQGMILSRQSAQGTLLSKISERMIALDVWAFGPNKDNGKNKEINDLREDLDNYLLERRSGDDRRRA
jgi:hypothetical protein